MTANLNDDLLLDMQKHIKPLNMNGLQGRMLRMNAPRKKNNKREILLVYGHHASIERMYGIAEVLNDFGAVTLPDLPGFGGMDSFYDIGMKPTLDNFADYMASFIKLRYKNNKKVTIVGMSLGFVIITRMLQRYPDLASQVELLISIVGFSHHQDFSFSRNRQKFYKLGASFFARKYPAKFYYNFFLHPTFIKTLYSKSYNAKSKFQHLTDAEKKAALEFEVGLWRGNDVRTHMETGKLMLTVDNCHTQIDLPVHHISIDTDQYFNHDVVEQHLRVIFTDFTEHVATMPAHAPSILASKEEAAPLLPASIKKELKRKSKNK